MQPPRGGNLDNAGGTVTYKPYNSKNT